jgi:hypothetical protein
MLLRRVKMALHMKVLWFAALALLLSVVSVSGEASDAPRAGLELILTVEQDTILPGEPVGTVISLRNSGTEAVAAIPYLSPGAGSLIFWIEDPSGAAHRLEPFLLETVIVTPILLYPGEQLTSSYTIVWDSQVFPFSEVGRNRLVATYIDGADTLVSPPVEVNVIVPVGSEVEAARLILNNPVGEFLRLGGYDPVAMADLTDLLARYPDSRYAPYVAYALAKRFSKPALYCAEPGSGKLEQIPPDYPRAQEGFQEVIQKWSNSPVADDAQFELARTYADMGDIDTAVAALTYFFEQYGATSDRLDDAIKLAEEWGWEGVLKNDMTTQFTALRDISGDATVTWLAGKGTARVTQGHLTIEINKSRRIIVLGDRRIPLAAAPRLEGNRLLVPNSIAQLLPRLLREGRALQPIPVGEPIIISG